jgi:hypothetical protein
VLLNETSLASGIFSGHLRASDTPSPTSADHDAPTLLLTNSSILEAWYPEPSHPPLPLSTLPDGRAWPFVSSRIARDAEDGSPEVHAAAGRLAAAAGDRLTITVVDADADVRLQAPDVVSVRVTSSRRFEGAERVVLTETTTLSRNLSSGLGGQGIFTGVLQTEWSSALSAPGDAVMRVLPGDVLTFEYHEAVDAQGGSDRRHSSEMLVSSPGLPARISLSPHVLLEDEILCVSVVDDSDRSPIVSLQWRSADLPQGKANAGAELQDADARQQGLNATSGQADRDIVQVRSLAPCPSCPDPPCCSSLLPPARACAETMCLRVRDGIDRIGATRSLRRRGKALLDASMTACLRLIACAWVVSRWCSRALPVHPSVSRST